MNAMDPVATVAEYLQAQGITVHTRFPGELDPTEIDEADEADEADA